jgi:acylphosphatase
MTFVSSPNHPCYGFWVMTKRLECHITGRVQLVMYRDFAMRHARALNIVGTVENMKDGGVHLIAEGDELSLSSYLEKLKRGPVLAHVEHCEATWSEPHGGFTDFSISYR